MTPETGLARALRTALARAPVDVLCVAVSGGGDSMALLHLAQGWGADNAVPVEAVTVDHGLRPEAAEETRLVARACATLGVPHHALRWDGWDGTGNLQARARAARYDLIARHLKDRPRVAVLLAHNRDDVAETFLMRLARGSGVDGLSRMRADWEDRGLRWLRPLLEVSRADLRDWNRARGVAWVEDPSNDDPRFDRVRARAALEGIGVDRARLAEAATNLGAAREVLRLFAHERAAGIARVEAGDVVFDLAAFRALPAETRDRLFAHALRWVATASYRPRGAAMRDTLAAAEAHGRATLAGCLVTIRLGTGRQGTDGQGTDRQGTDGQGTLRVSREPAAVADLRAPLPGPWDRRWHVRAPAGLPTADFTLAALGAEGLGSIADWRDTGLPRATLIATPGVFRDRTLVAAPVVRPGDGWSAKIAHPWGDFHSSLLSH